MIASVLFFIERIRGNVGELLRRTLRKSGVKQNADWTPQALSRESLEQLAIQLAESHKDNIGALPSAKVLRSYSANRATLRRVYLRLAEAAHNGENLTAGGEWLLDNYHVVERHAAQIKKYLPQGFYRTLPKILSGEMRGLPRVYHLALEFVMHTDASNDSSFSKVFVSAYQKTSELSSGELWAFPIMLRLALLENLRHLTVQAESELLAQRKILHLVEQVVGDETRTGTEIMVELARRIDERDSFLPHSALELLKRLRSRGRKAYMALHFLEEKLRERGIIPEDLLRAEDHHQASRQISVGNTLTSLTSIDQSNWRDWFESVSLVDAILRRDPAGLYPKSDFTTRDTLRHNIETISKRMKCSDSFIANAALECAKNPITDANDSDNSNLVKRHVGHYLIGEGRLKLEQRLSYSPPLSTMLSRIIKRHALRLYLGSIALLSILFTGYIFLLSEWADASISLVSVTLIFALLPVSELASSLVQYLSSRWVPPRPLPKLDASQPVSSDSKTLIVVHTIFSSASSIEKAIDGLEVRYLANDDDAFTYVLMADLPDASQEHTELDENIIRSAQQGIELLNRRHSKNGSSRFMLFFRTRQWNPQEGVWMAWERKRGKLEELNEYILGSDTTSLRLIVGDQDVIRESRYVITLDSDSQLSRDTARKLVATIAHPMNRPVIDCELNRVISGYAFIQPRVTISLSSATTSRFSKLFSGQAGLDPYTNVVSEVYQDLFGEGSFWGKGIYDVQTFEHVLRGRVPNNALLSHDLFEGSFARVALASDIELYDDFPSRYMGYSKRLHRWVRGDWQLLPWLFSRVPTRDGTAKSSISWLSWWKMFDNLRRSMLPPACLFALLGGWLFLPGTALVWTTIVLINISFPVFTGLAAVFALPSVGISLGGFLGDIGRDLWRNCIRSGLAIIFLPHQAGLMLHAISITLYRVYISKTHLLEWEPAERSERKSKNETMTFLKVFAPIMALVVGSMLLAAFINPASLWYSLPFVCLWTLSPWIAKEVSKPLIIHRSLPTAEERTYLTEVAYDTWLFFREYLRPEYGYLMPDNLQVDAEGVVAERTSPTNISLSMLSVQSAYDLGFIPLNSAIETTTLIARSIEELDKYRGHLYNWYSTVTQKPLHPRYISTVDSGNLLGHLYTLMTICDECCDFPVVSTTHIKQLNELLAHALLSKNISDAAREVLAPLSKRLESSYVRSLLDIVELLDSSEVKSALQVEEKTCLALIRIQSLLSDLGRLNEIVSWTRALQSVAGLLRTHGVSHSIEPDSGTTSSNLLRIFNEINSSFPTLGRLLRLASDLQETMRENPIQEERYELELDALRKTVDSSVLHMQRLQAAIVRNKKVFQSLIDSMDFSFLYDNDRDLFAIGFNAEHARRDKGYYDLLASEARLLSFLAVARGEVPQKHWFSLGRSLANTPGGKALISWSGTMFEYLMPFLVMRDFPTTILGRTSRAVVSAQMAYSHRKSAPWGISESAYSGVDFEKTYQYRAFGVPGLGLKRGLSDDLVVSPYSTMLALNFAPSLGTAIQNLHHLEREGGRGQYGFYEAIDYTHSRHTRSERKHIVQSFFAHHQGMSLVSINNVLNADVMCERFHKQPVVRSAELLLHERFPQSVAAIVPHEPELALVQKEEEKPEPPGLEIIRSPRTIAPRVRLLSNGRYSLLIDSAGGGASIYNHTYTLTRWREDSTCSNYGSFVYVHDVDTKKTWSTTYQPTKVDPDSYETIFSPGKAEFKRFDDDIFIHTEITVAPEDDVELRRITITNLSHTDRELEVVSYNEPALATLRADSAHPAFSKLFVSAEALPDSDAILCTRKSRSEHEEALYFFHRVTLKTSYAPIRFYTSRASFIGRNNSKQLPAIFQGVGSKAQPYEGNVDPIASLGCTVRLEPGASETLTFVSGASQQRETVEQLISRYQELMHVSRAFELSWSRAQVELRSHAYTASQADLFHRLAGCLFFNEESVRGSSESLRKNNLTQSSLWRFGVSGDLPIVLIKLTESRQIRHLQELLLAHHFLRERGLQFDLVVLHHNEGSYIQQLSEDIEYAVRLTPAGGLIDKSGGIFLRSTLQISDAESSLLDTVARVAIDCSIGGLSETLQGAPFEQTGANNQAPLPIRTHRPSTSLLSKGRLFNGIGSFARDTNHYHLTVSDTQHTPLPWSNVIANPNFGTLVTESGGGFTWSENSRENRITEWSNDPILDPPSEVIYLRNTDTGEYWSLTPQPSGTGLSYEVEHGFGTSRFSTNNSGIDSTLEVFVSPTDSVKWSSIRLTNNTDSEQNLELFLYNEVVMGVTRQDSYRFISTLYDRTTQTVYSQNRYNNEFSGRVCAAGSSATILSHTTSRLEFIGRHGDLRTPEVLNRGINTSFISTKNKSIRLSGRTGAGFDPCIALQVSIVVPPKATKSVHFFLSEHASLDACKVAVSKYKTSDVVKASYTDLQSHWNPLLRTIKVSTPNDSFDVLMNGWLLYQTVACRLYARSAFYQSGGALGFRDQLQDSLALLSIDPSITRQQIILHAAQQFTEGDVQHWWHPPTNRGVRTRISDDLLWLPYVVAHYIETTGDYSVLSENVHFLSGAPLADGEMESYFVPDISAETGTILEHCLRTFKATEACGLHGLPLIGAGDWNDGMNEVGREGKGESVWLAWFQAEVIKRFVPILETQGRIDDAAQLRERAASLVQAAEDAGWDGAWYRRAFYDDGTPLGSKDSDECQIDSLCQSWAVISNQANSERCNTALEATMNQLVDYDAGLIKLLAPPFHKTPKNPGYIKGYPPGVRENGGQYTHAAAWFIIAQAMLGRGTVAVRLFDLINPINHTLDAEQIATYQGEPYAMCGDVYSQRPLLGRAGWSWYTGSAGWLYQAGINHILGLKVSPKGFSITPCIPKEWESYSIEYTRNGRIFVIHVNNPDKLESGKTTVLVNNVHLPDGVVPYDNPSYGERVMVDVVMQRAG